MDFREIREFLVDSGKYIIAVIILLFVVINVFTIQSIIGPSMNPGLKESDILLLSKFHYKMFDIKRYDVIALNDKSSKYMVKRIIGLPGETVEYKDGKLYINEKEFEDEFAHLTKDFKLKEIIAEDTYFVLGDNRGDSLDSRDFGPIKKTQIIGKPYFRFWPIWKFKIV